MLKITKAGMKLVKLPYELNEPFVGVLYVRNTYKNKLDVQVKRYDKIDTDLAYPLAIEVMVNTGFKRNWNYAEFEYDRVTDGVDTLKVAHDKMKAFLLTIPVDPEAPEGDKVFTDSEIEIIDL